MKYLSLDIEATGLEPHDLIIELAFVPFDTSTKKIEHQMGKHFYIKCPSFDELKPKLNEWVIEHNKELIEKAHTQGLATKEVKEEWEKYLKSPDVVNYFNKEKIILFGKSMNSIDLPFIKRDFGDKFFDQYFSHKILDMSSIAFSLIDLGLLPQDAHSSSNLMAQFQMGEVAHTALEDAVNMAKIYLSMIEKYR